MKNGKQVDHQKWRKVDKMTYLVRVDNGSHLGMGNQKVDQDFVIKEATEDSPISATVEREDS